MPSEVARHGLFLFGLLRILLIFICFSMVDKEIQKLTSECAAMHSATVIDMVVRGSQQKTLVEVFIDAEGAVTSDLCSSVSRCVAEKIEKGNVVRGSYQMVVSSPGIERPLKLSRLVPQVEKRWFVSIR
jgi:ribosome maturation factor RimP